MSTRHDSHTPGPWQTLFIQYFESDSILDKPLNLLVKYLQIYTPVLVYLILSFISYPGERLGLAVY